MNHGGGACHESNCEGKCPHNHGRGNTKKTDPNDEHRSDDDAKENDSDCGCILFQEHNTPFLIAMLYSCGSYAADEYLKGSRGAMKVVGDSRSFNKGSLVLPTLIPPFEASDTIP